MTKMKVDLHCHTYWSKCSGLRPKYLIRLAKHKNLSGIAITDHNSVFISKKFYRWAKKDPNFFVIPGVEVSSDAGHILGLFVTEPINTRQAAEVIDCIREQDGISVIAHPFDPRRGKGFPDSVKRVDAIEVFNSRNVLPMFDWKAWNLAVKLRKLMTAGSDAHLPFEVGNAYVMVPGSDEEDFRRDLKQGKVKICGRKSPFFSQTVGFLSRKWRKLVNAPGIN